MSHVDEGTLHAYLDDRERGPAAGAIADDLRDRVSAHLAECDDCVARLRLAERQRARASDILLAAAPTIETPPFEAVQPLAAAARPRPAVVPIPPRTAPRRAWVPLAWAASLMLAVGAGWMGSLLWQGGEPKQVSQGARTGADSRADAALESAAPAPAQPGSSSEAPAAGAGEDLAALDAARGRGAVGQGAVTEAAASRPQEQEYRALAGVSREEASDRGAAAAPAAPPPPALALGRVSAEAVDSSVARRERVAAADVPAGQNRAANQAEPGAAGGVTRPGAPPAAAKTLQQVAAAPLTGGERGAPGERYPGDADVAWRTVTGEEAERVLGAPVYLVAGAAITEVAVAPRAVSPLVRIRQNVDGRAVEVVQWRDPASVADMAFAQPLEQKTGEQKALPRPPAEARAAPLAAAPLAALPLGPNRARDGGVYLAVPNTAHPVLLKTAAAGDLLELLARVRQQR